MSYRLLFTLLLTGIFCYGQQVKYIDNAYDSKHGMIYLTGLDQTLYASFTKSTTDQSILSDIFYVRVDGATQNILGHYLVTDSSIAFTPRFVPDPNVTHQVYFDPDQLSLALGRSLTSKALKTAVIFKPFKTKLTVINNFTPTQSAFPSNILRVYIHFSQPMGLQNPYTFISLKGQRGNTIEEPFVEYSEGLWNKNKTRLTLLFHPGRIKRGVGPNVNMGAIFTPGQSYKLIVSKEWKDASGKSLQGDFIKTFTITSAIRRAININKWLVESPQAGSRLPLKVKPDVPLDEVLAKRLLHVIDSNGNVKAGQWNFDYVTGYWHFTPENNWQGNKHVISIDPKLEDVAGNSLLRAFDRDNTTQTVKTNSFRLNFQLKKP